MSAMIVRAAELARCLHHGQIQADGISYFDGHLTVVADVLLPGPEGPTMAADARMGLSKLCHGQGDDAGSAGWIVSGSTRGENTTTWGEP
jgi:hypothetical protein